MSTITKEQLRERAREKVKSLEFIVTQTAFADSRAELEEELELARIALASLEAEAVCVIDQSNLDYLKSGSDADVWPASRTVMGDVLLYRAAPPEPVSVPDLTALDNLAGEMLNHAMNCERRVAVAYTHCAHRLAEEVRDLRAAMLQGADGNSPVIPDEVLSAIRKVARIRADFDDFDGDRRGIGDCLDEAEQELIVTINKHASVISAAPQRAVKNG